VHRVTATSARAAAPTLTARLRASIDVVYREMVKFGAVGAVAFLVDVGTFNLLRYGLLGIDGPFEHKPLTAKTCSVVVATVVAWLGNRYWTFRHRRRASRRREFVLFFLMNAAGLGIALACLAISHYVFGLHSALADNIAANVVGLGLGTLFRFWAYRSFVFTHVTLGEPDEPSDQGPEATPHELAAELIADELAVARHLLELDTHEHEREHRHEPPARAGSAQGRQP
jgi:putative flippase GtrA